MRAERRYPSPASVVFVGHSLKAPKVRKVMSFGLELQRFGLEGAIEIEP